MECNLIQELIDAHNIIDQASSLNDVIMTQGTRQFTVQDWFLRRPYVMHQLKLNPKNLSYSLVNQRLNQAMADLF